MTDQEHDHQMLVRIQAQNQLVIEQQQQILAELAALRVELLGRAA